MNIDEVNDSILADLASQHRTYFMTGLLSERIEQASLEELVLYAYGTLAASDESEEFRRDRAVRDHEGNWDCEVSPHFWRGVCDRRATFFFAKDRHRRQKTGAFSGGRYPVFKVRGTQLLLSRLYDFFRRSPYPEIADEKFVRQIDSEKGEVRVSHRAAQMAVRSLYDGAHVGAFMDRAYEIMHEWNPLSGCGIDQEDGWRGRRRAPDLNGLKSIPAGVFDAK